jgi:hypothetical protein
MSLTTAKLQNELFDMLLSTPPAIKCSEETVGIACEKFFRRDQMWHILEFCHDNFEKIADDECSC